jgi:DNA-binding response OmpR family regulator
MPSILMITAREEALPTWSGSDVFLYKPFDVEELVAWVRSLTGAGIAVPVERNTDSRGFYRKTLFGIG